MLRRELRRAATGLRLAPLLVVAATTVLGASASAGAAESHRGPCTLLRLTPGQCAQLSGSPEHVARKSWLSAQTRPGDPLVYAAQPVASVVDVASFDSTGFTPAGELVLGQNSVPVGLTVDSAKNLYVTISALFGPPAVPSVEMFPPGATKPRVVYTSGLSGPLDVAVDRYGTLYVADVKNGGASCASPSGGDGSIVEFAKGSTTPTAIIGDLPGCPQGIAVDAHANLYVSFTYQPASGEQRDDVERYAYKSTTGVELNLTVPGGAMFFGISVDRNGDLTIANVQGGSFNQIVTFAKGSKTPTGSIQYGGQGWNPRFFALRGRRLFAPAYLAEPFDVPGVMAEFDYPSGRQRFVQDPSRVPPQFIEGFAASP